MGILVWNDESVITVGPMTMSADSLTTSIHRMLLLRLTAATIVLSLLFAALAYYNDQQRIGREVVELARLRVDQFGLNIQDLLDSTDALLPAVLERRFDEFVDESDQTVLIDGRFVLARIYNQAGQLLLDAADESFPAILDVRQAVDGASIEVLNANDFNVVTTEIEGLPIVGVAVPLNNSADEVVAQVVGVFAISAEAIDGIRGNILLTMLYVTGLVVATALTLYPIIGRLLDRLSRQTVRLLDSNLETLQVLAGAIAKRDSDTDAHNYRVSVYSVCLAEAIKLPRDQIQSLIKGALLHDVGKLGIRDNILLKPGKLTEVEFTVMKTHVDHGMELTDRASWLKDAQAVVGSHHEKYDGAGYPAGLKGEAIPLAARIFAVTDVFDALTSRRPYKEPLSYDETMQILDSGRGSHFDPSLLDAFYPIARDLYDTYSGKDDHKSKERLEMMTDEYFKRDAADLLT
jgi:HD-GYP domain-containing protein (c-di-GMP phosphodiesterase class II)